MRRRTEEAIPALCPTLQAGHVGFGSRFINKNKMLGIKSGQFCKPLLPFLFYIFTLLLVGMERFFYTDNPAVAVNYEW
jgi:hypothetical protein